MVRGVLAVVALLFLAGCGMIDCAGAAVPGAGAGDCRFHTTFLAAAALHTHARALAKS
jgi:hypothetical protein